jgi:hypothetical protein
MTFSGRRGAPAVGTLSLLVAPYTYFTLPETHPATPVWALPLPLRTQPDEVPLPHQVSDARVLASQGRTPETEGIGTESANHTSYLVQNLMPRYRRVTVNLRLGGSGVTPHMSL